MTKASLTCFTAYDIRGRVPDELDPGVAFRVGRAFAEEKAAMRREDAVYGGEVAGHYFFRDFAYCDSGMIPWLLVAELMSRTGQNLWTLVDEQRTAYPCSGEINFEVPDPNKVMEAVVAEWASGEATIDRTDGVSVEFADWRFNLRPSNTEPLLRLSVETAGDPDLLQRQVRALEARFTAHGGSQ